LALSQRGKLIVAKEDSREGIPTERGRGAARAGGRVEGRGGHDMAVAALEKIAGQPDDAIDVAEAALILASFDHPASDLGIYRDHLREVADAVAEKAQGLDDADNAAPEELAGVLAAIIAGHFRYNGDEETYDDLDNANFMRVIERRKGLPVSLGILYLSTARAQGWAAAGLSFPGHFLIRIESRDGRRVIIDPFHSGRVLEAPALRELLKVVAGPAVELEADHYRAVSNRDVLIRLQNNIKSRRLDMGMVEDALAALLRMQILSPDQPHLWREAGLMHMRLGRLKHAIEAFEGFVSRAPDGAERQKIVHVIRDLRDRLN
jgi:regulator of sirC expression with transglutaminase-like and TPR domain